MRRVRVNIVAVEKKYICNRNYECVCIFALVIGHANRYLFCAVLHRHLCPVRLYNTIMIGRLSHKRQDFRKKNALKMKYVF
jgi:hypothetical protein